MIQQMNKQLNRRLPFFVTIVIVSLMTTSCHSLRNITARDDSGTARVNKKKDNKGLQFLDDIEMRPGGVVTSKHKTSGIKKSKENYHYSEQEIATSNIEAATQLQFKYAVITNTEVEKLNNKPLLEKIDEWWGTKYSSGGNSKDGIDCSGFSSSIFRDVYNIQLPHSAQDQYNSCDKIAFEDLKQGDLVFFHTSRRKTISHVGIYLTNNKFVHASSSEGVTISDMNDKYWSPRFIAAGRVKSN